MNKSMEDHFLEHHSAAIGSPDFTKVAAAEKIEQRRARKGELILEPQEMDILCGQDKTYRRHPGNEAFNELVATYANAYHEAITRQDKMTITNGIVDSLQDTYNTRFLRPVPNGWEELSRGRARDKVSHALRWVVVGKDRTRKARKRRQRQSSTIDSKSSSSSLSSASSIETEMFPIRLEGSGSNQTQPHIETQQDILLRRRSFPELDSRERSVVAPSAAKQRSQSEPNIPLPTSGDRHCCSQWSASPVARTPTYDDTYPTSANSGSKLSSFDEALTNSELANLVRAPILADDADDLEIN